MHVRTLHPHEHVQSYLCIRFLQFPHQPSLFCQTFPLFFFPFKECTLEHLYKLVSMHPLHLTRKAALFPSNPSEGPVKITTTQPRCQRLCLLRRPWNSRCDSGYWDTWKLGLVVSASFHGTSLWKDVCVSFLQEHKFPLWLQGWSCAAQQMEGKLAGGGNTEAARFGSWIWAEHQWGTPGDWVTEGVQSTGINRLLHMVKPATKHLFWMQFLFLNN